MENNYKHWKEESSCPFVPALRPLSTEEKKELEMRIYVAICQSAVSI